MLLVDVCIYCLRTWPGCTLTRQHWCGMGTPCQDRKLWASSLNHCLQASSKFTRWIVSLFMVSRTISMHLAAIFFLYSFPISKISIMLKVWNIMVHYTELMPIQQTAYSFSEQATQGQTTLLVITGGTVKFEGNKQRFFNQNFLLTAQATPNNDQPVWKIASDCFRFQDWNNWGTHSCFTSKNAVDCTNGNEKLLFLLFLVACFFWGGVMQQ